MPASCHNRLSIGPLTDNAREWDLLQHRYLCFVLGGLLLFVAVGARNDGAAQVLLALCDFLPLLVELPALFDVCSIVEEYATVSKATVTGFFVIFADIGFEVHDCDG